MNAIPLDNPRSRESITAAPENMAVAAAMRSILIWAVIASLIFQCFESWDFDNVASALIITASAFITFYYVLRPAVFAATPLTALMILGFNLTTQSGAIIALSCSMRPLTYNLHTPILSFSTYLGTQLCLILANEMWQRMALLRAMSRGIALRVLRPLGFFTPPSDFQLWAMGLFGCMAIWVTSVELKNAIEYGDAGGKFLQSFGPLSFAPALIPAKGYFFPGNSVKVSRGRWVSIAVYLVILLILASVRNSRGTFFVGLFTCAMMFLLAALMQRIALGRRAVNWLLIGTVAGVASFGVMSDLAIAMVLARGHVATAGTEMAALTWANFKDRDAIDRFRLMASLINDDGSYTEPYVENPVISRFVLTKFHDSALYFASDLSSDQTAALWSVTMKKTLAPLPTPLLQAFDLGIDKKDLEFTIGDYLYYLHSGRGLGGHRVGSATAHGWALMGLGFYPFLVVVLLVVFTVYNSFTLIASRVCIAISPVALLALYNIFFVSFLGESINAPEFLLLRELPQALLAYFILFQLTRFMKLKRT